MGSVKIGTVTISEAYEVTQTWETASNYTLHEVQPGTYDVMITTDSGTTWVLVKVDTIVKRHHYVNRVFSASSSHDETPNEPGTYTFQMYDYSVAEAATVGGYVDGSKVTPRLIGGEFRLGENVRVVVEHVLLYTDEHHTSRHFQVMPSGTCAKALPVKVGDEWTREMCGAPVHSVQFSVTGTFQGICTAGHGLQPAEMA
jgi:hypothetical protein